jgi:peptidyl-prolyl cis-trans isomerase C
VTGSALALLVALFGTWPVVPNVPDDHVVARVQTARGEVTITAGRLRAYAQGHEGTDPRRLVQDLVDFELLAAQAEARGLADDPQVREEARPVLIRHYLHRTFESLFTPATVPVELLRQSYERNRFYFTHTEGRAGDHILVTTADSKRPKDEALDAQARALAERIHDDLVAHPPADADAFMAAADRYKADAKAAGLVVRSETLGAFPREGRYVKAFTDRAFELTQPGSLSAPIPTEFGWHVFRLANVVPARDVSFEQAEAELREKTINDYRTEKLRELTDGMARELGVVVNFDPIEELQGRRQAPTGGEGKGQP